MGFKNGDKVMEFEIVDICGKCNIGMFLCFLLDLKYFDLIKYLVLCLIYLLCVKVVLCFGLYVKFIDENSGEILEWYYQDGLKDYLLLAN